MSNSLTTYAGEHNPKGLAQDNKKPRLEQISWRLPCRGCMTSCKNYAVCGGKPWQGKDV